MSCLYQQTEDAAQELDLIEAVVEAEAGVRVIVDDDVDAAVGVKVDVEEADEDVDGEGVGSGVPTWALSRDGTWARRLRQALDQLLLALAAHSR